MLTQGSNVLKRAAMKVRPYWGMIFHEPFQIPAEKSLYWRIIETPESGTIHAPIEIHPTCLGGIPVLCRPGTRDKSSLEDLLFHQVYLPPASQRAPSVIVDLGVNVGYTAAHFAFRYPSARIVGVELDSGNYALALKNVAIWKDRISLLNAAIWTSDGFVTFDSSRGQDAFRVDSSVEGDGVASLGASKRVRSITMESLMREFDISHIDYLKMDIEGAEADLILNSDCAWLERVSTAKIELHNLDYRDFERSLRARGFRCSQDAREWTCIVAERI